MTEQCITCAHVRAKGSPAGFGTCKPSPQAEGRSRSITAPRSCRHHSAAAPETVAARKAWLEGKT
jgi:hypothetical protein